jgi:hypothetical protein
MHQEEQEKIKEILQKYDETVVSVYQSITKIERGQQNQTRRVQIREEIKKLINGVIENDNN